MCLEKKSAIFSCLRVLALLRRTYAQSAPFVMGALFLCVCGEASSFMLDARRKPSGLK